jgi:hypothetical protein
MWQQFTVAVIVFAAFLVSAWKLMPARRRLKILVSLDAWAARRGGLDRFRARVLQPRIQRAGGGCDGCAAHPARAPHHRR